MALRRKDESSDDDDELLPDRTPDKSLSGSQQGHGKITGVRVAKLDDIIHDEMDADGDVTVVDDVPKRHSPPPPPSPFRAKDEPDSVIDPDFIDLVGDDDDDKDNDTESSSASTTPIPVRAALGLFRDAARQVERDQYLSLIFKIGSGLPKSLFTDLVPDTDFKGVLVAMHRYADTQSIGDALCANIRDTKANVEARAQELRDLAEKIRRGPGRRLQFLLQVAPLCMSYAQCIPMFCDE